MKPEVEENKIMEILTLHKKMNKLRHVIYIMIMPVAMAFSLHQTEISLLSQAELISGMC